MLCVLARLRFFVFRFVNLAKSTNIMKYNNMNFISEKSKHSTEMSSRYDHNYISWIVNWLNFRIFFYFETNCLRGEKIAFVKLFYLLILQEKISFPIKNNTFLKILPCSEM